ncbi:MAG: DUF11 domain-containing protein [Lewinella sp.]|nr:DUF11 domain-containing protein [Lewinella sp.]
MQGQDEDDHDQATVSVEIFDLALIKLVSDGQTLQVEPGDTVSFTIRVINQGMIPADNILVTDYIGAGLNFDAGLNPAWSLNADGEAQTTLHINGGLQPGASTEVEILLVIDAPLTAGSTLTNTAEISGATDENGDPQTDVDSTPDEDNNDVFLVDNDVSGHGNMGEDEDDHDIATLTIELFDLALTKVAQDINVAPGDTVTFTIEVTNQGLIAADNILVTDYIPAGLNFEADLNPDWTFITANGNAQTTLTIADGDLPAGGLAPGESVSVDIVLVLDAPIPANTAITNIAEISGATDENGAPQVDHDSTPNDNPDDDIYLTDNDIDANGLNGGDEDDHDIATIRVLAFDLALRKTPAAGEPMAYQAGDTVTFTITVFNQGMIPADNIEITDYIPANLNFDAALNPGWSLNADGEAVAGLSVADGELPQGGLPEGGTVSVNISLIISNPLPVNTLSLTNVAEISNATDENGVVQEDIDSWLDGDNNDLVIGDDDISGNGQAGGDEDDHDPATIQIEEFDLALRKTLTTGQLSVVQPGQPVSFTIEVFNQGTIPADNIAVTDYLPAGLLFDPALNPAWTLNGGNPQTTLSVADGELPAGGLQPGASAIVTIVLTVDPNVEQGLPIRNTAEISAATDDEGHPGQDIDSTPDSVNNDLLVNDNDINGNGHAGGDEDDHDIADIKVDCYKSAGFPNKVQVCLGCSEASVYVDLFDALKGHPDTGGYWTDETDSGVDLSDPTNVLIPGTLDVDSYFYTYTIPGVNGCVDKSATVEVEIVSIENLYCNGATNVSLGENCETVVTPDFILQGNIPCYSSLEVHILNPDGLDIGNVITGDYTGQTLFVQLVDPQCGNNCWGTLTVEDKKAPKISCPDDVSKANIAEDVQYVNGNLSTTDPALNQAYFSCLTNLANASGTFRYDLYTFTVTQPDTYVFDLNTQWGDGFLILYQGDFNPAQPCQNIIAKSDDVLTGAGGFFDPFDPILRIALPLVPGKTYTLMTTSGLPNQTGDYTYAIYSDGDGLIEGVASTTAMLMRDLLCEDADEIFNNPASLSYLGMPTATDNCDNDVTVTFSDFLVPSQGDCGKTTILRTFTATDNFGNFNKCVQEITIRKPTLADVILPPFTTVLECDESFATTANGYPSPSVTGYPFLYTLTGPVNLGPNSVYCNLGATFSDGTKIVTCDNSYKFIRTWTLLNWCEPGTSITYTQLIKVGDFTPPTVIVPQEDSDWDGQYDLITYSTGPFDCTAAFEAPLPTVTDLCSNEVEILIQVVNSATGEILTAIGDGDNRLVTGIPTGCYVYRYLVTDGCGNQAVAELPFMVEDRINPIAVCNDDLHISLGGDGYAEISAADVDEGSNDNCGPIRIEVRRQYTVDPETCEDVEDFFSEWGDKVGFTCCDVNSMVRIELRVWDDRNGDGIPGNTIEVTLCNGETVTISDNSNICWFEALVEDKIAPACEAPHDVQLTCVDMPYDLDLQNEEQMNALFGMATGVDNCPVVTTETVNVTNGLDDCGFGTIIRRFRAKDANGTYSTNLCQQLITVSEVHNYEIRFPKDAQAICGEPNPDTILTNEIGCDILSVNVHDETYTADDDECYKILRTYRVINWCEWDGEADPIVIGRDEDCDDNPGDEHIWLIVRPNGVTYLDRDNQETNANPAVGTSRCTSLPKPNGHWANSTTNTELTSVGHWEYTQVIKVYDNIDPVLTFESGEYCSYDNLACTGAVEVSLNVEETCSPNGIEITVRLDAFGDGVIDGDVTAAALSGTYPDYTISGTYPIGHHKFLVTVRDGCENQAGVEIPFDVVDCKAPTPVCINGLAVDLMPVIPSADVDGDGQLDNGAMTVWATDLIASPVSDCTPPITYSINAVGDISAQDQTSIILTCDDLGTLFVEIHAWDGAGNHDYCQTYIQVQNNNDTCPTGDGSVSGVITTEEDQAVEGVHVQLSGQADMTLTTLSNGQYAFSGLLTGYDYTITPELDENYLNGVSTFDLILMAKHILGVQLLDSPYKMIAADINNSGTITTLDAIQLRKLILNITNSFANNTSWRFVDAGYLFPVPNNPWFETFPEIININDLSGLLSGQDFIGVKIGDLNGSVQANALDIEPRNLRGMFYFDVDEMHLKAGNEYRIAFTAADIAKVQGFQGTLKLDQAAVQLKDLVSGAAKAENFGMRYADEGVITFSWHRSPVASAEAEHRAPEASAEAAGDVLFTLVVQAMADADLRDILAVSSRYTPAEAYNQSDELMDLGLRFNNELAAGLPFELYQNKPNPFSDRTVIGFQLPEDSEVTITIHDVSGKAVKLIRDNYAKGYNQLTLSRRELNNATGVLYYTVTAGEHTATKKMVVLNR